MAVINGVWFLNMFVVSQYLNRVTPSDRRATVLSFRGLSFNLAYGLIGILYSLLLAGLRSNFANLADTPLENAVFIDAMAWFPWYFLATIVLLVPIAAWLLRGRTEHRTVGKEPEN